VTRRDEPVLHQDVAGGETGTTEGGCESIGKPARRGPCHGTDIAEQVTISRSVRSLAQPRQDLSTVMHLESPATHRPLPGPERPEGGAIGGRRPPLGVPG